MNKTACYLLTSMCPKLGRMTDALQLDVASVMRHLQQWFIIEISVKLTSCCGQHHNMASSFRLSVEYWQIGGVLVLSHKWVLCLEYYPMHCTVLSTDTLAKIVYF